MKDIQTFYGSLTQQLKDLLAQISPEKYQERLSIIMNASIGQHYRHIIEFFTCFREGVQSGVIDYNKRKRDIWIETIPSIAVSKLSEINSFIDKVENIDQNMDLVTDYYSKKIQTTFLRELSYNIDHSVHHMAIIKIAIKNTCPHVKLPEGFGVASSTLKYQALSDEKNQT